MKVVLLLSLLVLASAAPDKRFLNLHHIIDEIKHSLSHAWDSAKSEFNHLTRGIDINFDAVVQQLIPLIDSGMTEGACSTTCVGAASTVLGPAALLADSVCGPLCKAALVKLEQMAG